MYAYRLCPLDCMNLSFACIAGYKGEGVGKEKENSGKKMEEWEGWGKGKKEFFLEFSSSFPILFPLNLS